MKMKGGKNGHPQTYRGFGYVEEKTFITNTQAVAKIMPLCPPFGSIYKRVDLYEKIKGYITAGSVEVRECIKKNELERFGITDAVQACALCVEERRYINIPILKAAIREYRQGNI